MCPRILANAGLRRRLVAARGGSGTEQLGVVVPVVKARGVLSGSGGRRHVQ